MANNNNNLKMYLMHVGPLSNDMLKEKQTNK